VASAGIVGEILNCTSRWDSPNYIPRGLRVVSSANLLVLYCSSLVSARGRHSRPPSQPGLVVRSGMYWRGTLSTRHVHTSGKAAGNIEHYHSESTWADNLHQTLPLSWSNLGHANFDSER
jgi:hypothetical protein